LAWFRFVGLLGLMLAAPFAHGDSPPVSQPLSPAAAGPLSPTSEVLVPIPGHGKFRSLSITAFYSGASADRLADDSAYDHRLQMLGAPLPVTFAAASGEPWFMGALGLQGTTEKDYFVAPTGVFPTQNGKFIGCVVWTYYYGGPGNVRTPIIEAADLTHNQYFTVEVGMTRPVLVVDFSPAPSAIHSFIPYHGMEFGHTYVIRIECREDYIEAVVDGKNVGCVDLSVSLVRPEKVTVGTRYRLEYGVYNNLVGDLMVSTDPDEPYPPLKR
jgi:hypothetical protein